MKYQGKKIKERYQTFEENQLTDYKFNKIPANSIFDLKDLTYNEQVALFHIARKYQWNLKDKNAFILNGSSLARLCNNKSGNNAPKFNKMIEKFFKLKYLIDTNYDYYDIDFIYIIQCADNFNKNTSTDSENIEQEQLSQESNINTQDNNKVSQIEEKEPVIENQVITLKQEENIQDITLNDNDNSDLDFYSPTNIINENTSTDSENLEQEQLSQESNISTSNEIKSSQIEEKEPLLKDITGLVINKNNNENKWLKYADKNSIAYNEINRFTQQSLFNFYCYNKRNFNSCTQEEKYMYFSGIPNYNSDFLRRIFLEIDRICSTYNDSEFNKFYNSMVEPFNAYISTL